MPAVVSRLAPEHVGLTADEYRQIVQRLGREPNQVELGMLGAMWSEHCGYKHTRPLLKLLPTGGSRVAQGPGENAGAVDIGDGTLVVLKMESHNHPSAVEPYQGAATGVGGIVRDIFTMGARPIALLDSLRFGPPDQGRGAFLLAGVVAGIAGYGNCIGVPTVGGEVVFHPSYAENPLVNVMCVGLARKGGLVRAKASGPGNPVILVGADTGRDGIQGATFASAELDERSADRRPAVQVGNPFLEKLLLEACLELIDTGVVIAMQDLGAAGLTSSTVELAARGGCGIEIDVERVGRRESGMTPYEVMLSESQERMLVVVPRVAVEAVRAHFARWELRSDVIGRITDDGSIRVLDGPMEVARLPLGLLTDEVPTYVRDAAVRPWPRLELLDLPSPTLADLSSTLLDLIGSPNLCSRKPIFRRYDQTVQANTVIAPGFGAALLRLKGSTKALAITTDGNSRYCRADARLGAQIAVAEAARNISCTGAEPVAATDCLNYGNPERPEVYGALKAGIEGLADACRALGVPIVSGNVSLYNESNGTAVYPTPIVGMVGLLRNVERAVRAAFQHEGDIVALLGPSGGHLGCSVYLSEVYHSEAGPPPPLDLRLEAAAQRLVRELAEHQLINSANDCSDGGLGIALAESCLDGGQGFIGSAAALASQIELASGRADAALFGEGQSRVLISYRMEDAVEVTAMARAANVPLEQLGTVGGERLAWGAALDVRIGQLREVWAHGLDSALG